MFFKKTLTISILATICLEANLITQNSNNYKFEPWQEGYFDIHHIETGGGNSTFCIFPDGTTMLIDAGVLNEKTFNKHFPLKISSLHPSDSLTSGGWIAHYIRKAFPSGQVPQIDFALVSHFHSDHYGDISQDSAFSKSGKYQLTGITEVGDQIPIGKLIDRNYPDYNYPVDLRNQKFKNPTFLNYLKFIDYQKTHGGMNAESLQVGSNRQIGLTRHPGAYPFSVRNIKSGGTIWTGTNEDHFEYFPDSISKFYGKLYHENQLSIALKLSYGPFDYFTGGDLTGLQGYGLPEWFDVETPVAKVVGPVDVATLDHHGNRDACNEFWIKTLQPQVFVQQSWCSDHPGQEVFYRLSTFKSDKTKADIFATFIHEETKVTYGGWFVKGYKSMEGHVVIRVMPGGKEFYVFVLDDNSTELKVKNKFGPYTSR